MRETLHAIGDSHVPSVVLAWAKGASRREQGMVGEKVACNGGSAKLLPGFLHLRQHNSVGVRDDVYPIPAVAFDAVEGVVGHLAQVFRT